MPLIELPRALEDYFAFAETEPTRRGRRFSITLAYARGDRMERLQWWYHVNAAEEQMFDGHGIAIFRERAVDRFKRHIERWLEINRLSLRGGDPIPRIGRAQAGAVAPATNETESLDDPPPLPVKRIANAS